MPVTRSRAGTDANVASLIDTTSSSHAAARSPPHGPASPAPKRRPGGSNRPPETAGEAIERNGHGRPAEIKLLSRHLMDREPCPDAFRVKFMNNVDSFAARTRNLRRVAVLFGLTSPPGRLSASSSSSSSSLSSSLPLNNRSKAAAKSRRKCKAQSRAKAAQASGAGPGRSASGGSVPGPVSSPATDGSMARLPEGDDKTVSLDSITVQTSQSPGNSGAGFADTSSATCVDGSMDCSMDAGMDCSVNSGASPGRGGNAGANDAPARPERQGEFLVRLFKRADDVVRSARKLKRVANEPYYASASQMMALGEDTLSTAWHCIQNAVGVKPMQTMAGDLTWELSVERLMRLVMGDDYSAA